MIYKAGTLKSVPFAHTRIAHYFAAQANGLTRYGLPIGSVIGAPVWLPPAAEQRAVGRFLRLLDEAIACAETVIAKLKQIRAGLLHDLLTRGLDENGEMRDPNLHPEQFQGFPLGTIPKQWEIARLGPRASRVTSGSRGWAAYYSKDGPIFLRIGNLTREHINLRQQDLARVRPPSAAEGERTRTQSGDILISITADLGIIGVVPDSFPEAYVNQHIALVRPGPTLVARWIARLLASGPGAKQFQTLNDSGAKAGMNLPSVESLLIAVPGVEEQREASRVLDEADQIIEREEAALGKLTAVRRGLADDLLTGRVRVPPDTLDTRP